MGVQESSPRRQGQLGYLAFGEQSVVCRHSGGQRIQPRFGCEEGFRDAKWWLGFTKARIAHLKAWSRMFALFAMTLLS